jgi:acyl carrier protein
MVPSFFLMLDQIPLTANGKVDRRALPAPDNARPGLEESFVGPRTPIEKALVEIWTDVLGINRIGVNDSFFDLGGHSMLATQLVSRARQAFKVNFPLQRLFSAPTIFSMALTIEEAMIAEMEDLPEAVAQMLIGL